MDIVPRFGLYKDEDNLHWLLQQNESHNLYGLPSSECPFVISDRKLRCPHFFNLKTEIPEKTLNLYKKYSDKSELLRLFNPVPEDDTRCVYVETSNPSELMLLNSLLQLSCPVTRVSAHIRSDDKVLALNPLHNSNIGRMLLYGATSQGKDRIIRSAQETMNIAGRLFIAGEKITLYGLDRVVSILPFDPKVSEFLDKFETVDELRALGSSLIKRYMTCQN